MFMSKEENCPFCNSMTTSQLLDDCEHKIFECTVCGKYIYKDFYDLEVNKNKNYIASFLFQNKKTEKECNFIGTKQYSDRLKTEVPSLIQTIITPEIINNYKIMSFSEKIELLILYLGNISKYMGEQIQIPFEEFVSAAFVHRFTATGELFDVYAIREQVGIILKYLTDEAKFLDYYDIRKENIYLTISIKGWKLIEEIQKNTSYGKKVFIAMSFATGTENTRESLKKGITEAGYEPVLIDEVTHNHQIVPEMFKQIRDSKFLVIDVSVPNNGAYYEAGYALGLGKEVIFCCKKETFADPSKRPHFDVSQKQMIVWENEDDLSSKLTSWIKSLFE